jgi:carbon monoxide dehydrogenase subunit G
MEGPAGRSPRSNNVKLEYNGQEKIPASSATVWAFVTDPSKVGYCLPEVVQVDLKDATHFDATVRVAVGPVRGNFKLKCELLADAAKRHVDIKVSGGGLGSTVDMNAGADVVADGDGTVLNWRGVAEVRGPAAAVGGRVLDAQAQKLITQTFSHVREKLSA